MKSISKQDEKKNPFFETSPHPNIERVKAYFSSLVSINFETMNRYNKYQKIS